MTRGLHDRVDAALRRRGERVRGADDVVGVEPDGEQPTGVEALLLGEAGDQLPPQRRARVVQAGGPAPRRQHVGHGGQVGLVALDGHGPCGPAALDHCVTEQHGAVGDVVEDGPEQDVVGDAAALGQLPGAQQVHAGAQRTRRGLHAGQRREAGEPLRPVGRPVRVVGVDHGVTPLHGRVARRRLQAGGAGVRVVLPLVAGVGPVEQGDAVLREQHRNEVGLVALDVPGVGLGGQARSCGAVDVERVAGGVGRHGVDPRDALDPVEDAAQLGHRAGAAHLQEMLDDSGVVDVGVAVGERQLGTPAQQRHVEHRAVVRAPQRAGHGLGTEHLDGVLLGRHGPGVVAVAVGGGVGRVQVEPVEREPVADRERVGPRQRVVEAHLDAGRAEEGDAVDVVLAGDRQVALPEPGLAVPGEVRVGEHHAAARRRHVAADGPAVAGQLGATERLDRRGRLRPVGPGRLGPADQLGDVATAGHHRHVLQVGGQVLDRDGSDPLGTLGPLSDGRPGEHLLDAQVVARRVALDELAQVDRLGVQERGGAVTQAEHPVAQVGRGVGVERAGAEELGPLAADLDDLLGDHGQVVTGARPALAQTQAAPVLGPHVHDAVSGGAQVGRPAPAADLVRPRGAHVDILPLRPVPPEIFAISHLGGGCIARFR